MTKIKIGLDNADLYAGCKIEEVAGRYNLVTPVNEAVNIVGRNIAKIVEADTKRDEVILTGLMAIWAYLIVFHTVVHHYRRVYYDDGKNGPILIAAHG